MQADLNVVLPQIVIAIAALLGLAVVLTTRLERVLNQLTWMTAALFAAMALWLIITGQGSRAGFGGSVIDDPLARFAAIGILVTAAVSVVISFEYMLGLQMLRRQYPALLALCVVGMLLMVGAQDLIVVYVSVELQAAAAYGLLAMRSQSLRSTEAALKAVIQGLVSSAILLFGASLVVGFSGSTSFDGIAEATASNAPMGLIFGLVLVFAGLAHKLALVPFHSWSPDVHQGATSPMAAFMLTAPKLASLVLLSRFLLQAFPEITEIWQPLICTVAAASMLFGAIFCIIQRDIKRFLAYAAIAHMGFMLSAIAAASEQGAVAMLLYLLVYVCVYIGIFAFVLSMESDKRPVSALYFLNRFAFVQPGQALALLILLLCLAGIPPLPGFLAKVFVLQAVIEADLFWLTLAVLLSYAIGAFGYVRIVYLIYFGEEREPLETNRSPLRWGVFMGAAALMVIAIPGLLGMEDVAREAALALVR
ncbi:MAG: NADH-quinone oxidoreductase subunit N [Pseudomonadota bacterium]